VTVEGNKRTETVSPILPSFVHMQPTFFPVLVSHEGTFLTFPGKPVSRFTMYLLSMVRTFHSARVCNPHDLVSAPLYVTRITHTFLVSSTCN